MDSVNFEKKYKDLFSNNENFQQTYLKGRMKLYRKIVQILKKLEIESILDVGCAYGLLVEEARTVGIDSWGLDYPIEELKSYHQKLPLSSNNFIYGNIEDDNLQEVLKVKNFQAIVLLDTLRSLNNLKNIISQSPKYIIVKDACDNDRIKRKPQNSILSVNLYGPVKLMEIFPDYDLKLLYSSKFILKIEKPSLFTMKMINYFFPTYCAVLEKRV